MKLSHLAFARGAALAAALALAACANYSPRAVMPGMDLSQTLGIMGEPHARYTNPDGGTRLEYDRGPAGLNTFMIDLDPQGRVIGWQQVLTERNFNAIAPGTPASEMLRRIGRPGFVRGGGREGGQVWTYRFNDWACRWWLVSVVGGVVGGSAYMPDPRCEGAPDRSQ